MKHKKLLWGLLILCCLLFVRPAEGRAAEKVYTINITKTTPAAAEKKLRRMKASSKQELQLMVDVTGEKGYKNDRKKWGVISGKVFYEIDSKKNEANEKLARKKMEQWLKQFQKLKTNTYGLLPTLYNKDYKDVFSQNPASGCYVVSHNGYYVSDYVNMNMICDKAYAATQGKCEYRGDYLNQIRHKVQKPDNEPYTAGIISEATLFTDIPVRQYSKTELKKQSDSVRVQCLMYGVSDAKLFTMRSGSMKKMKRSLYDIARGKGVLCSEHEHWTSSYWAYCTWVHMKNYLSMDLDVKAWSGGYLNPQSGSICAKNASGNYDYYEISDMTIRPENTRSSQYFYMKEHLASISKLQEYNWITKGKATEADEYYLRQALKCFSDGSYMEYYMSNVRDLDWWNTPVKMTFTNKNQTKYGFTSASYTVDIIKNQSGLNTWKVTKN